MFVPCFKTIFPSSKARNNSDEDDFPSNNQDSHHPPTILINEDVHGDQSEINDESKFLISIFLCFYMAFHLLL